MHWWHIEKEGKLKMKRKIFALLLSLCMVLTMMPSMALAEGENGQQSTEEWQWHMIWSGTPIQNLSELKSLGDGVNDAIAITGTTNSVEVYLYLAQTNTKGAVKENSVTALTTNTFEIKYLINENGTHDTDENTKGVTITELDGTGKYKIEVDNSKQTNYAQGMKVYDVWPRNTGVNENVYNFRIDTKSQETSGQNVEYRLVLSSCSDLATTNVVEIQNEHGNLGIIEPNLTQEKREFKGYFYVAEITYSGNGRVYNAFQPLKESETPTPSYISGYDEVNRPLFVWSYEEDNNTKSNIDLTITKDNEGLYTLAYNYTEEEYAKIYADPNDGKGYYVDLFASTNQKTVATRDNQEVRPLYIGFTYNEIVPVNGEATYKLSYEMLIDPNEYTDENGSQLSGDRMNVQGQGNNLLFTDGMAGTDGKAHWYTCFYVMSSKNNYRDARYNPDKYEREIRTYIGDEDDFVIEAKHYGEENEWFNENQDSSGVKGVYTISYEGAMKGFYPVYEIIYDKNADEAYQAGTDEEKGSDATDNYEFRIRYTGDDPYMKKYVDGYSSEEDQGNAPCLWILHDDKSDDFSFDQNFLDEENNWATGNVQYFDRVGQTLTTKMIIRPAGSCNAEKKILYSRNTFTYIEGGDEIENFKLYYATKDGNNNYSEVEVGDSPFEITWVADKDDKSNGYYTIQYKYTEKDLYGPEYKLRYTGEWKNKLTSEKYGSLIQCNDLTFQNRSAFFTSKSTQYVDKIENGDEGKPYINAYYNGGGNVNTTEVIVEKGAMSGTATEKDVRIGTNQAVTDLSGSLVGNMKTANDENSVSVTMQNAKEETKGLSGSQKNIIDKDSTVAAVDFSITSENKDVAFGETGAARVYINLGREVPSEDLDEYYVYYIDDKGKATKIKAEKIEQTPDGEWEIIFTTNHFSTYIVSTDGTLDQSSSSSSGSGSSGGSGAQATGDVTNKTEDKTGNTIATTTVTVKNTTTTAADGTKTVAAKVDTATANKIIEKAVENKSTEVVVNAATAATVTETAAGTKTEVAIPAAAVSQVAEKTEAAVTIKSDAAEVTLDKEAVKAVAEAAGTAGEVKLEVATIVQDEGKAELGLKLVTSKGNVSDFKGGSVSVTIKLNAKLAAKDVKCVYIDDNSVYHGVKGQKNADGTFTFKTGHFSSYAVMTAEEADKVILAQEAKAVKLTRALSLKARSAKTAKGYIKVTLAADEDVIKQIEDLGYTVKYKFYRSTKKAKAYVAKSEKAGRTYTNTAGKKGTKYYYKARVMVYDAEGTLVAKSELKQCRYAARTK